ncbi:MAG: lysophospholipid acyltransferase family protein [Myxococcota bacterium]
MVVGESPLKDVYRRLVWGPWRLALERAPHGWEYRANRRLGLVAGTFSRSTRARVEANLRRAFPDRDVAPIARATFAAHFANQYASFAFARITADTWPRYLRWEGLEHVEAARAAGEGLVLMHPHMGPAQLPLAVLGAMGLPVHQIGGGVTTVEKSATGRWAADLRKSLEARMRVTLHDGAGYLRAVVRALRAGGVVLTAGDGTGGGRELGRRLPREVLGQVMNVPVAAFWLAHHGGARLHPLHVTRDGDRHVAVVGERLPVTGDLDAAADLTAAWLDHVLRAHPEEWLFWDAFEPGGLLERNAPLPAERGEGGRRPGEGSG